jgi:hypothetical protein
MWSMPNPVISRDSGSCKLRSPVLSATKSMDLKTHLELGRKLLHDWNAIDLM